MELYYTVTNKVRLARGRKPKFKRHKKESFVEFLTRYMQKDDKLNKAIIDVVNPKPDINKLPLFYLTKPDYTAKIELEKECWMKGISNNK